MNYIAFDIETRGLPWEQIKHLEPKFEAPSNYKDPKKIADHIVEQRMAWIERAALSPTTSEVLAIGLSAEDTKFAWFGDFSETDILELFWDQWRSVPPTGTTRPFIGFQIKHFDLPFLVKRSWHHNIMVPSDLLIHGRKWNDRIIDLAELWECGYHHSYPSLDMVSKFLKIGEKTGSGADFARVWESDRTKAIDYLKNDLDLIVKTAKRMGVI